MRGASRRSALHHQILAAPGRRGEVRLQPLLGESFRSRKSVEDCAPGGTAMGDHRHSAHTEQGSAPDFLVVDAALDLLQLGFH